MRDTILYGDCLKTLDTLKSHISIGICDKPRMCVTSPLIMVLEIMVEKIIK